MGFFTDTDPGFRSDITTLPPLPKPLPEPGDLLAASFRQSNTVGSLYNSIANSGEFTPDPNHNPLDVIRGTKYEQAHLGNFTGSRSEAETREIMRRIDAEDKDRQTIESAGIGGVITGLAAGALDPTMFLPGGVAIKAGRAGIEFIPAAKAVGAAALAQTTAQETVLHSTQETRTLGESAVNVASGTILAALMGGAALRFLSPVERLAAVESVDRARADLEANAARAPAATPAEPPPPVSAAPPLIPEPAPARQPAPVGAAVADTRELSPAPYGLEALPKAKSAVARMFPTMNALENGDHVTKAIVADLAEIPIRVRENIAGGTTTLGGGPAVDREINMFRNGFNARSSDTMLGLWAEHRFGDRDIRAPRMRDAVQRAMGETAPEGKLTFDQFDTAVYDALRAGDTHAIPQVAEAAQWMRRELYDPVSKRATAIEGFKPLEPREGESYAPQLWNTELIRSRFDDHVNMWTDHLAAQQTKKAAAKERITAYHGALTVAQEQIDKTKAKIAQLSEGFDIVQARAEEATRLNKFAFQRAENLRESQYRNDGGIRVAEPGKNIEKARGGAVFETKVRDRGNVLADQMSAKLAEIDALEQRLVRETTNHDAMRTKIEAELAAWEGKSAGEAQSALKARAEAEKAREAAKAAGTYQGKGERLKAADGAIDSAVSSILKSDRDLSRQELRARAQEIAGRIISTPEGRLPYDMDLGGPQIGVPKTGAELRGNAAHREIDLPYDVAAPWLDRSATRAAKSYLHSVWPDTVIAERFGGDPNMLVKFKEIEEAYAARAAGLSETASKKLMDQRDTDMTIVAGLRDRTRGVFGYDPSDRNVARVSQAALKINNIVSSHMMAVSSLPDMAGAVFRHGFESGFGEAWGAYFRGLVNNEAWQALKKQGKELEAFGIGVETATAARQHALQDINELYRPASKVERALSWASDKSFIVNLLAPLTDVQKRISANVAMNAILRASKAVAEGKATQKQLVMLGESNIKPHVAERIWQHYSENGGDQVKGVYLPNLADWPEGEAKLAFQGAIARDVDIAVVTPGQEKPFWMSRQGWNLLGQYHSFNVTATQRILIANLQRADAASLAGTVTAITMGMLAYRINTLVSGQPASARPADWFKEGISRGGVLGALDDANTIASKMSRGGLDIYRLIGADKPLSRMAGRNAAEVLLGPTYGKIQNLTKITGSAASREWTASDTHAARMAILGSNLPFFPRAFETLESAVNRGFNVPDLPPPKH
jgi:hypothetical protein